MKTVLLMVAVAVAAALLVSEAALHPAPADRFVLVLLFVGMAAVTVVAAWWVPRWASRSGSLRSSLLVVSLSTVVLAGVVVGAAALAMFLSPHDLRLVFVALVLGVGLGGALALAVARPLAADLQALAAVARRIGSEDPGVRTGVRRKDEVGALARAIEGMASRLADAHAERNRSDAARREFLAAVSHDLRTPLTAIQAALEALQDGVATEPQRYLQSMAHQLALLRGLVDDLFLLARIEAGDLRLDRLPLDLTELAEEAVEAMLPIAHTCGVGVQFKGHAEASVSGDPKALGRVLRNLLDNAIRHAPAASNVLLETMQDDGQVTTRVRDTGPGFPPGFGQRALESFTTADRPRKRGSGAGLGLAIARGFVHAHGGALWVEPGPGGVVAFTLPVAGS
jgi:signal transduction histidine kinase